MFTLPQALEHDLSYPVFSRHVLWRTHAARCRMVNSFEYNIGDMSTDYFVCKYVWSRLLTDSLLGNIKGLVLYVLHKFM